MASKIKVDNIENQCGGAVVTKCGATTTISGSVVKANDIQAADGGNLINQCGTTITLGASGDTINLASGASQTGFGRTGTVDWDTTAKTASFTAVSGEGYFVNTTSGAVTVTLPAGSAGNIVSLADYAATWQTNAVTVTPNGTDKIGGISGNATLSTEGQSVTFIYSDLTQGWLNTMDSTSNVRGASFIIATGGTITCCGDYKIHTFTGPGTFTVSSLASSPANDVVDYLVVAGGGGAGGDLGAAGGAGGFRIGDVCSPGAPPLSAPGGLPVSATTYPITVGSGGAGNTGTGQGTSGSNSIFSTITSAGGGGGAGDVGKIGLPGGSGGGNQSNSSRTSGNTPPVAPPQGNNGGLGNPGNSAGGGGGATAQGSDNPSTYQGGAGGNGAPVTGIFGVSPQPFYGPTNGVYAGGGGGGSYPGPGYATSPAPGGTGGGGPGSNNSGGGTAGTAGTANTGGGGGGGSCGNGDGGAGGSGVVIIRYRYQ
jgi:hypothetical protein